MYNVAAKELSELPETIETCTIVYFPHIGFLFTTPCSIDRDPPEIEGFEFRVRCHRKKCVCFQYYLNWYYMLVSLSEPGGLLYIILMSHYIISRFLDRFINI